jgi:hypothetical protein
MLELFDIYFNGVFFHLGLTSNLSPETVLHLNIQSIKTRLFRGVGLHMPSNLISQLPERLLCSASHLSLPYLFFYSFLSFLGLHDVVLDDMRISPFHPCSGHFDLIKISV